MAEPFQVFLSYSHNDEQAATLLRAELERAGLSVFKDDVGVREGELWLERLQQAVDACGAFVVLVGRDGVRRWIGAETQVALSRYFAPHDETLRLPIFPILLGETSANTLPAFLRLFQTTSWDGTASLPDRLFAQIRQRKSETDHRAAFDGCPFVGLAAYRADQAHLFFGRQKETLDALACFFDIRPASPAVRWLEINGNSGSGKSSLMQAGLLPLIDKGWLWRPRSDYEHWTLIGPMMPGEHPVEMLAERLAQASGTGMGSIVKQLEDGNDGLRYWLRERKAACTAFLLAIDQFEELFTFADADQRLRFDGLLAAALEDSECPLFVISTVRSDFLDRFAEGLPRLVAVRNRMGRPWTLAPIVENGLREVIDGPARLAELDVSEIRETMVAGTRDEPGALPLVENALQYLWEQRNGDRLDGRLLTEQGGVAGILSSRADDLIAGLDEREQPRALELLFQLVRVDTEGRSHTRRRIPLAEAVNYAGGGEHGRALISKLAGRRFLGGAAGYPLRLITVTEEANDGASFREVRWVNLIHETLIRSRGLDATGNPQPYWPNLWTYIEQNKHRSPEEVEAERRRQQAEIEEQKRQAAKERRSAKRFRAVAIIALALFLVALAAAVSVARLSLEIALQRSRVLAQRADYAMNLGDHRVALLLALEALPAEKNWSNRLFKPVTEEAKTVLASAVLRPLGSTLSGHDDPIRGVAFIPKEDVILTASEDKTAKLWMWKDKDGDWKPSHTLEHDAAVNSARFSPDGTLVVTGADNGWAYIWDARNGEKLAEWPVEKGGGRTIVDISPDNKRIATVVMGGNASIWDWDRREGPDQEGLYRPPKLLRPLIGEQNRTHAAGTNFIAFDRTGGRVVTASWRGQARVWDVETGKLLQELSAAERDDRGVCTKESVGHCDAVFSAEFDPANPDRLVTASLDKTALIWDLRTRDPQTGKPKPTVLRKLVGHYRAVTYAAFTKDGGRVITAALDGAVRLWDAETGETLQVLQGPAIVAGFPASAALSWNEDYVVASFSNKWAFVWKFPPLTPALLYRLQLPVGQPGYSTADRGSRLISVAGLAVDVYDPATSKHVEATRSFARGPVTASIAPVGQIAVASGPCAKIYEIDGKSDNKVLGHVLSLRHRDGRVFQYEGGHAPDGKVGKIPCDARGQSPILSIAYDPSGQRIVTTSQDGTAKVWDAATGKLLAGPLRHDGAKQNAVFSGVFSRDGRHVLTGSFDGTVRVWNAEDGSELHKIEVGEPVLDAAYSDDGQDVVVEALHVPDKPVAELLSSRGQRTTTSRQRRPFGISRRRS